VVTFIEQELDVQHGDDQDPRLACATFAQPSWPSHWPLPSANCPLNCPLAHPPGGQETRKPLQCTRRDLNPYAFRRRNLKRGALRPRSANGFISSIFLKVAAGG